ncbi:iron(III) transport system permease protein [Facklamia miroungae]|uniref:Iron(III) transport system permease protein n=2 Tax=Facklamia miroungae TaxID=120956 RepID=A0A1G7V3H0_9LACT|nr:iron(III) transport system permease protein [Facklamia miroungae]
MSFKGETGFTFDHYSEILIDERTWRVFRNTLIMVFGSTTLASFLGVLFAWLMAYSDIRWKRFIQLWIFLPFIIPSYVSSLAWVQFFGRKGQLENLIKPFIENFQALNLYSMTGIILVMGFTTYPLVYLLTVNAFRQIPREIELAARISGANRWETFVKVTLPMASPGLAGGIFIAFLSSLDNFGIPAFLGSTANITVLTTYIYQQVIGFGPTAFNRAAVLSVLLGGIALIGVGIQWIVLSKSQRLESQSNDMKPRVVLGRKRFMVELAIGLFFIGTSVLPLGALIVSPLYQAIGKPLSMENITLKNYAYIFQSTMTKEALFVSLKLAFVTAAIALIVGTLFSYYRVRKFTKITQFMESAITLPYALPGTVFALAMILSWMQPFPGWNPGIYGSIAILYIAYFTRFLNLQVRSSIASFQQLDISIEEASQMSGSNGWVKWKKILLPLIIPTVLGGTTLVFLTALTELTVSSLLYSSQSHTIGVSILSFQQSGYLRYATAFSSIIVILILFGYLLWIGIQNITKKRGSQL